MRVLPPGGAPGDAVVSSVRRLLEEPVFRAAAEAVARDIAAMPSPAEVAALLTS